MSGIVMQDKREAIVNGKIIPITRKIYYPKDKYSKLYQEAKNNMDNQKKGNNANNPR